ncbi:plasmid pRiA4b ORF-3 family protein [Streptomyces sp. AcE210]|uniref:plasmid pRiA4b ORF-3 family protein n=1 Tax=Streptomyces sp. AcE210 TaxID=2292703 RepID=UPI001F0C4E14|nr:plasmid pRiA4b ORF-3 family protein [Streptomyces sp. AcE210]
MAGQVRAGGAGRAGRPAPPGQTARLRAGGSAGPWGYANFIEAVTDPGHEEHDELLEWVGGTFDPVQFDVEDINKRLTAR